MIEPNGKINNLQTFEPLWLHSYASADDKVNAGNVMTLCVVLANQDPHAVDNDNDIK